MREWRVVSLLFALLLPIAGLWGQPDFKAIKKEIPAKKVKHVQATRFSDRLYLFHTKSDTGVYDAVSKTIILSGVKHVGPSEFSDNWIEYETYGGHGVYALAEQKTMIEAPFSFRLSKSLDKDLVIVTSPRVLAMLDLKRNRAYGVDLTKKPKKALTVWEDEKTGDRTRFDPEKDELIFSTKEEGQRVELILHHMDGYLIERTKGLREDTRVLDVNSGEVLQQTVRDVEPWKGGYRNHGRLGTNYYDKNFKVLYRNVPEDGYRLEHFKALFDDDITGVQHVRKGLYKYRKQGKEGFYDVSNAKELTGLYDKVVDAGPSWTSDGRNFILVDGGRVGLFDSQRMLVFPAEHQVIQLRAYPDGSYGYRVDDQFFSTGRGARAAAPRRSRDWGSAQDSLSAVIYHVSSGPGGVLLSLRKTEPEVTEFQTGTHSLYRTGSGLLDGGAWRLKGYHAITPYKGYYLAQLPGDETQAWSKTVILDADFQRVDDKVWGAMFVHNGRLIGRNEKWELVEYDVVSGKTTKVIGELENSYEDFMYRDGFLFLGHQSYDPDGARAEFDVMEVISPSSTLVAHEGLGYLEYLGDGLIVVGRIPEGKVVSGSDLYSRNFDPDQKSIMDLYSGELKMPWCKQVFEENGRVRYWLEGDAESQGRSVPLQDLKP